MAGAEQKPHSLVVRDLPAEVTAEALTDYFEEKFNVHVEAAEFAFEGSSEVIVTLTTSEGVKKVLERGRLDPFMWNEKEIRVEVYIENFTPIGCPHPPDQATPTGTPHPPPDQDTHASSPRKVPDKICSIEVEGVEDRRIHTDDLIKYFDDAQSGSGGENVVKSVTLDRERGVAIIKFKTHKAVQGVLSKTHKVNGCSLKVKEHVTSRREILIGQLPDDVSMEDIRNFLEAKYKETVIGVLFNEDKTKAVVQFENDINFDQLKQAIAEYKFHGDYLEVEEVAATNCILVSDVPDGFCSTERIELYFENKKRSSGGDVLKVQQCVEPGQFLVHFQDRGVIDAVCGKTHFLDGTKITVQSYQPCLGKVDVSVGQPVIKLPPPIVIQSENEFKIKFVLNSEQFRQKVENHLQNMYAKVTWPSGSNDQTYIECTLTEKVRNFRDRVKTWPQDAKEEWNKLLRDLDVVKYTASEETWKGVRECLSTINIENPDSLAVFLDQNKFIVTVAGETGPVKTLWGCMQKEFYEIEAEIKEEQKKVKEKACIKSWQARYLDRYGYVNEMGKKYKDLVIIVDIGKSEVEFFGSKKDVLAAERDMYKTFTDDVVQKVCAGVDSEHLHLLTNKETEEKIQRRFREKKIGDVWEIGDMGLILYGSSDEVIKKMEYILKDQLTYMSMTLDSQSVNIMKDKKWKEKKSYLEKRYSGCICIAIDKEKKLLVVYTTKDLLDQISEDLQNFFEDHVVYKEEVTLHSPVARFMRQYMSRDINVEFNKRSPGCKVTIDFGKDHDHKVIIEGDKLGLNLGKKIVTEFERKIKNRKHTFKQLGFLKFMKTDTGKKSVTHTETECTCVIELGEKEQLGSGVKGGQSKYTKVTKCASVKLVSGVMVSVFGGDMTELCVNVLVNAANVNLDHVGGLALAISKKGGPEVQTDCNQWTRSHGKLSDGDVYMGKPGHLSCNYIAHAVGPVWHGGKSSEESLLKKAIKTCLDLTIQRKQRSIAFPALSAGVFGYPVSESCAVIVRTVVEFCHQQTCLEEVILIDVSAKTVQAFVKALSDANCGQVTLIGPTAGNQPPPQHVAHMSQPANLQSAEVMFGKTKVLVVKGEMANEQVDMIVNSAKAELDLKQGMISRSLLNAAGQAMQNECTQKYPQGISVGNIAVTGGGKLKCQVVAHAVLPLWRDVGAKQALQNVIHKTLREADQRRLTSVSFPTFGTGLQQFPKEVVAHEMFDAVHKFCSNSKTSLTLVRMVVYPGDHGIFKVFQAEEDQWLGQGRTPVTGGHQPPTSQSHGDSTCSVITATKDKGEFQVKGIKVLIYKGDITEESSQGIVCPSNKSLDLKMGKVSQAIAAKGGPQFEKACDGQKNKMKQDGIAVTCGGKLKCVYVIHTASHSVAKEWGTPVYECIKIAEQKKIASLAFPALGTSIGCKADEISEVIYTAITEYQSDFTVHHLKEVKVVIFLDSMLNPFIQTMKSCVEAGRSAGTGLPHKMAKTEDSISFSSDAQSTEKTEAEAFEMSIYAQNDGHIDKAIKAMETALDKEWVMKVLREKEFEHLRYDQVSKIKSKGKSANVEVTINKTAGFIKLEGLCREVMNVDEEIQKIIRQLERSQYESREAKLMKNMIKWFYLEGTKQREFEDRHNLTIETAFQQKENTVKIRGKLGGEYEIDFSSMKETDLTNHRRTFPVIRRDLLKDAVFANPDHWALMEPSSNVLVHPLQQTDKEYKDVVTNFNNTSGGRWTIVKVERIQNRTLYAQYMAKKKQMELQNTNTQTNEQILWHGTAANAIESINYNGFNRSYCGKNAVAYGNGVYFAVSSSYSTCGTYSPTDDLGDKRLYSARVLTGEYTTGGSGMRVPPVKTGNILYDSVADYPSSPSMFIIFNDTQAYPEHLITFR